MQAPPKRAASSSAAPTPPAPPSAPSSPPSPGVWAPLPSPNSSRTSSPSSSAQSNRDCATPRFFFISSYTLPIMTRYRFLAVFALIAVLLLAYFVWSTQANPESPYRFKLGLDLAGGTELVYKADMSETPVGERADALAALQGVIDRRVNLFGVAEPIVQTEQASVLSGTTEDRLIVDLPGVTNIDAAVAALGKTPTLEFMLATTATSAQATTTGGVNLAPTNLPGRPITSASLQFGSGATAGLAAPQVLVNFNSEGATLFEKLTSENVGQTLGIFLDGQLVSNPVIREAIPGGTAVISGDFTAIEARDLVRNLNFGALPVPIELESSSAIGPTLGAAAI